MKNDLLRSLVQGNDPPCNSFDIIRVVLIEKGIPYDERDTYIECLNKLLGNIGVDNEVDSLNMFLVKNGAVARESVYDALSDAVALLKGNPDIMRAICGEFVANKVKVGSV